MQLQLHYITQRYTTLTTPHCATTATTTTTASIHCTRLHYTTLITQHYNYTTLHYTRLHYSTQHYSTLRYTTLITPHHNYNCNCTTLFTLHYNYNLQLQLHYITLQLQLQLHYTTLHPAVVARWPLQPLQPLQKTQLQPPSVDSLCHLWPTSPIGFLFLKLLPPPCAVLLVYQCNFAQPAIQGFSMGFSSGFQAPQVDRRSLTLRVHASWNLSCLDQAVPTQWCYNLDTGGFLKWKIP